MKYVKVPEPLPVQFVDAKGASQQVSYNLKDFLREFVWIDVAWRNPTDPEWQLCALRLIDKLDMAESGNVVELLDKDHEKLISVASLQDQKLNPQISAVILKLFSALSTAKDSQ